MKAMVPKPLKLASNRRSLKANMSSKGEKKQNDVRVRKKVSKKGGLRPVVEEPDS